jgi:predicted Rossmann fold nucleotide-binding protein DprA/Smf involved in DNA uptake
MENIIASYNQAEYFVEGIAEPIRIGQINQGVDKLLDQFRVSSWCFVTAWNPLSVEFGKKQNLARNQALKGDLSNYQILEGEGRDINGEWQPERSFLVLGISLRTAKEIARKYGQRAIVFGQSGEPAALIETLFTLGNCEIFRQYKTAFLCSRKVPALIVSKCIDWAISQCDEGKCVISGFHSTVEKEVLNRLLAGNQPIVMCLARGINRRLKPELEQHLAEGRLLIITPFDEKVTRVSKATAAARNRLMVDVADQILVGYAEKGGILEKVFANAGKKLEFL